MYKCINVNETSYSSLRHTSAATVFNLNTARDISNNTQAVLSLVPSSCKKGFFFFFFFFFGGGGWNYISIPLYFYSVEISYMYVSVDKGISSFSDSWFNF